MKNAHPSQTVHSRDKGWPLIREISNQKLALYKMSLEFHWGWGGGGTLLYAKMPNSKVCI